MTGVTPRGLRYPDGATKAKNLGPELQQFAEDVDRYIDEEIDANSPTFVGEAVKAAKVAVQAELDASPRIPEAGELSGFRVLDMADRVAFAVTPDGEAFVAGPVETSESAFRVLDLAGRVALEVTSEGRTIIHDSTGLGAVPITRVRVVIGAGQSLASGRGRPLLPELDTPHPRLFQVGYNTRSLRTATSPLDMQDAPNGISPLWVYGIEAATRAAPGEVVVVIPAGRGGTGLASDTSANGCWHPDYAGPNRNLYTSMLGQLTDAIAAIGLQWPEATIVWEALLWNQGEYDAQQKISRTTYRTAFCLLIDRIREWLGVPIPILIGQSVPEWQATESNSSAIQYAQTDVLELRERTAFVYSSLDGSNYNDLIHPARGAVTSMGLAMFAARAEALSNVAAAEPVAPADVKAERVPGGAIRISWKRPLCFVRFFRVQYRVDGGAWQTPARPGQLECFHLLPVGLTGAVEVTVTTVGLGSQSSAPSTTVLAR